MSPRFHSANRFWILAGMALLAACQSWRTQSVAPAAFVADAHPSKIRLLRADGTRVVVRHPVVRGDSITGREPRDSAGALAAEIQRLETLRFDPGKTAGLAAFLVATPVILCAATCDFGWGISSP